MSTCYLLMTTPFPFTCDASREGGLGFVLTQPKDDKVIVLQCGSTTLSQAQRGYSIVELEMLSVVWSLEKCDYIVRGAHNVTIFTDHAPLCGIERKDLSTIGNQRLV